MRPLFITFLVAALLIPGAVAVDPGGIALAGGPLLALSPTSAAASASVTVSGTGFKSGEQGRIYFEGSPAGMPSYKASNRGNFSVRFNIPSTVPGAKTITARNSRSVIRASATLTVVNAMSSPTPTASVAPSSTLTPAPTAAPTVAPTPAPTAAPTIALTPAPTPTASPNARYVSMSGIDSSDGTATRPWRTLQRAANAATGKVYVLEGTYSGFTLERSGLSFEALPLGAATITGQVMVRNVTRAEVRGFVIRDTLTAHEGGLEVENSSNVTVADNVMRDNSFGLKLKYATSTLVENNEFTQNASGIEVHYAGDGVVIRGNRIYQNTRYLDSSRSATGINFYRTTGHSQFTDNVVWGNHTADFTTGVGVEIYAASNVTISRNVFWDNGDLLETGTKNGVPCDNLTFTRNLAYRSEGIEHKGLILRCASNSLVAHNTLIGLDKFAFGVSHLHGTYGGSVEGLRILNNIAVDGRAFSIDNPLPSSVAIDHNLSYTTASSTAQYGTYLAYVAGKGQTRDLSVFRSWTGYEQNGVNADPRFVAPGARDYRLSSTSPAVDRGVPLPGVTWAGLGPDLGYLERP